MARGAVNSEVRLAQFPGLEVTATHAGGWEEVGGTEPDPSWRHVDEEGHCHFYVDGRTPSLDEVFLGCGDETHDDDCRGASVMRCRACGQTVAPGRRDAAPVWVDVGTEYVVSLERDGALYTFRLSGAEWAIAGGAAYATLVSALDPLRCETVRL